MNTDTSHYRLALLLSTLGEDIVEPAIAQLPADTAKMVRDQISKLNSAPASNETIEQTLDEFEVFLKFAVSTLQSTSGVTGILDGLDAASSSNKSVVEKHKPQIKLFEPTDDPIFDLQRLDSRQLAAALSEERPKTIALVLSRLDQSLAASTIELLPENIQTETFMLLKSNDNPPEELINRVALKVVENASASEPVDKEESNSDEKLAQLLRELPKKTRSRLVDEIQEKDEETATKLRELLYVFEDIALYENRSVQKILSSIETGTLVSAMQDAESEIHQKIFANLSKRASETLKEELSFASKITEDEVDLARSEIAKTIGELDSNGEITLE